MITAAIQSNATLDWIKEALTELPHLFDNNKKFCYNTYRKDKEKRLMYMFDDFDTQICCEEFYNDAEYWEAMMSEEVYDDEREDA